MSCNYSNEAIKFSCMDWPLPTSAAKGFQVYLAPHEIACNGSGTS